MPMMSLFKLSICLRWVKGGGGCPRHLNGHWVDARCQACSMLLLKVKNRFGAIPHALSGWGWRRVRRAEEVLTLLRKCPEGQASLSQVQRLLGEHGGVG